MKLIRIFLILIPIFIINCSSTHHLQRGLADEFAEKFNKFSQGKTAELKKVNGTVIQAQSVCMGPDSVYWIDPPTGSGKAGGVVADHRSISSIKFTNSGKGVLEGLGVGFLAGFSTGAIVGFASGDDESGWVRFTAAGKALIGGIALGTVGGITGLVIGAATGHKDIFILNDAHDYYPLVNAKLVEETADTIRFRWRDKTYQMNKSEIFIERKNERTNIYMTKKTFNRSVTKEPDEGDK